MNVKIKSELQRLTANAALRREDLLRSGLRKSRIRKALNIAAGMLALLSAGAIAAVITKAFGGEVVQYLAALIAASSGVISLFISAYFSDDETLNMLSGASKYLALRESVYRIVIHPELSDKQRFSMLTELQDEYAKLDEAFSKYFSLNARIAMKFSGVTSPPPSVEIFRKAVTEDVENLHRKIRANEH